MNNNISQRHLAKLPRVFQTGNGKFDLELLEKIFNTVYKTPKEARNLLKDIGSDHTVNNENLYCRLAIKLPTINFRERWYREHDIAIKAKSKIKLPKPFCYIVDKFVAANNPALGLDIGSPALEDFFEKRENKLFPIIEHIGILSDLLISTATHSLTDSALFAWSMLENAEWNSFSQPHEKSLTQFREALLADLRDRGAIDLLEQLEDGDFSSIEIKYPQPLQTPSTHKRDTSKPIDLCKAIIPEDNPEIGSGKKLNEPHALPTTAVSAEINPSTSVHSVDCWVLHIDELTRKAEELKKSSELFTKNAKKLVNLQELTSFVDSGDAASILLSLESDRRHIQNQSGDIRLSLTSPCKDASGNGCELLLLQRQIQDSPASTSDDLIVNVGEMGKKAHALLASAESAKRELKKLECTSADLRALIGSSDSMPAQLEQNTPPCRILVAASEQRKYVDDLKKKLSVEIIRRRDALIAECDQLNTDYNLSANTNFRDCLATYADLRSRVLSAEDIKDIEGCKIILGQLKEECRARGHNHYRAIASRLLEDTNVFPVFLELCRALIDQSESEIAFMLLHLRQHLHPVEEIAEITDQALSILLEAACGAASGELPMSIVWSSFCADQWLLSTRRDDIESSDLHERIVITLLGTALAGNTEEAATNLVNIGTGGLNSKFSPKILDKFLQAVVTRQAIKIASTKELAVRQEQECGIQEKIAFEGGKYRHIQNGGAPHFARFEAIRIFPALTELWRNISSDLQLKRYGSAHSRLDSINVIDWYNELNSKHDNTVVDHPHFSKKIRDFMEEFVSNVKEHVTYCENIWVANQFVLNKDELEEALQQWAGKQTERSTLVALILKSLELPLHETIQQHSLINSFALCKPVILQCPHFVTWLRAQQNPEAALQVERLILEDIAHNLPLEEAAIILDEDAAWKQLSVLYQNVDAALVLECNTKHKHDEIKLSDRRNEILASNDQNNIEIFDACIHAGRFPAAHKILNYFSQQKADKRAQEMVTVLSFVDNLKGSISAIEEAADDANMPEEWQESVYSLADKIRKQLRILRRSEEAGDAIGEAQAQLSKAVQALSFVVHKRTPVLEEVVHYMDFFQAENTLHSLTENGQEQAQEKCPDIYIKWKKLSSEDASDETDTKVAWAHFVKEFAKICKLYYGEHYSEKGEIKRFGEVNALKANYPIPVFQTYFKNPQSEFLKRPLRLYLYRPRDINNEALRHLETELSGDKSATWLHVVFVPQGLDKIRSYFKYDKGFKNFLLVDDSMLNGICLAEKHDVPLRQALHSSVTDLASSSPFVAQGYCHEKNNIYVGRKDTLQKLLITPHAMIWGGRRIGKTSVLHALESALVNRGYIVAYVYVDIEDKGDPDEAIAQKIAATLGVQEVVSVTDLERQITILRNNGSRIAILIDETDEYIKKSRKKHGSKFPLATALRQLVMDDSKKETFLVYSGFHQLYFETRFDREKRRVGYPFINLGQEISLRDLTHEDVVELLQTGFNDMLGIVISPEVPRLISELASPHPAFVQQFCRCLLEWVSKRRSPGKRVIISQEDVKAVFDINVNTEGGEQPFILYVNETLGYNLSHLGRAIMLAVPYVYTNKKQVQGQNDYFSTKKIKEELNSWCDLIEIEHPLTEHFTQTIELLKMTNMLTQNPDPQKFDEVRLTYPAYIKILERLDKLGKSAINLSLVEYDVNERAEGVLL